MAEEDSAPAPRRRTRAASGGAGTRSTSTTRRRLGGVELVDTLNEMVSQLIKENRTLKRQLARLAAGAGTVANGSAERTLRSLQRKVQRAVASAPTTRRRRTSSTSTTTRPRTTTRRRSTPTSE
jgi:hypothetical protein